MPILLETKANIFRVSVLNNVCEWTVHNLKREKKKRFPLLI